MNAQADGFASLAVATALLLGLLGRKRGNPAPRMLTTMLSSVTHAVSSDVVSYPGRTPALAVDPQLMGLGARYRLYEAADGWVFLAAPNEKEWVALVSAISAYVDLGADERFAAEEDRRRHDHQLANVLAAVFRTRPKLDWENDLLAADVACVAVTTNSVESMIWSEEFGRDAGYVRDVRHPTFDQHPRLAPLVRFSRSSTQALPGCLAGQHTDALLREIGYDTAAIDDLRKRQIVA
jgi:crotonobetainyl-CoA:carnitine CoA-transferase CaiB-like acyl-CoA transferase